MNDIPSFLVNYRLMSVLKYQPLTFIHIMTFLVLEVLSSLKINCVTKIFSFIKKVCHC